MMTVRTAIGWQSIVELAKRLDDAVAALAPSKLPIFGTHAIAEPSTAPPDCGFLRVTTALYVLFVEHGGTGLSQLCRHLCPYCGVTSAHVELVRTLRTVFQHRLPAESSLKGQCELWFKCACGVARPESPENWETALSKLLLDGEAFLQKVIDGLASLANDCRQQVLKAWDVERSRNLEAGSLDNQISEVASDMGLDDINVIAIRRKYIADWSKELRALGPGEGDQPREVRSMIEDTLLEQSSRRSSITGEDLIVALGVQPGSDVLRLLRKAKDLANEGAYSREELLARLHAERVGFE